jgi:hypothetical protein
LKWGDMITLGPSLIRRLYVKQNVYLKKKVYEMGGHDPSHS